MSRRERNAKPVDVLEQDRLAVAEERERVLKSRVEYMKSHVVKHFGQNNIMFDCVADYNPMRVGYVYNITCKLCGHITKREQRTKMFFVCGGCYREWDKEEDEIIMPNNDARVALARKNGKLVLPCDPVEPVSEDEDVESVSVGVTPIVSPQIDIAVRTFTHVILQPGQFYQIGDYIFEYVD